MSAKRLLAAFSAATVLAMPTTACAEWLEARTANFVVVGDWTEEKLVDFAKRVDHFDQALRLTTLAPPDTVSMPVRILVLRDAKAVRELYGASRDSRIAGYYRATLRGPQAVIHRDKPDHQFDLTGEVILFHEHTHHFMLQHFPVAYPAWYVEGFAEYHSTVSFTKDGDIEVGLPSLARLPSLVMHKWLPLRRLFASKADLTRSEMNMLYAQGWLLTHYMFADPIRNRKFGAYLRYASDGTDSSVAMERAFQQTLEQLDKELSAYFLKIRRKGIGYRRFTKVTLKDPEVHVRKLSPAEIDAVPLDALLAPRVPQDMHGDLQARAATLISKHPTDPFALTIAAEAAFATEQFAEAEALADRAMAAQPLAQRALSIKGAAQLYRLARLDPDTATTIKTIRSTMVRANRANPNDPMALYYFFQSFLIANEVPTENAVTGLLAAYQLAPQVADVRLALAQEMIRQERVNEAINVLKPLAYSPHGSTAASAAYNLLTEISPESAAQRAVVAQGQDTSPVDPKTESITDTAN